MQQNKITKVSYMVNFHQYWLETKRVSMGGLLVEELHRVSDRCDLNHSKVVDSPFYDVISNCLVAN